MVKRTPVCYGIRKGRGAPTVVHSWAEVVAKTDGFSGAEFKKFKSENDAATYVTERTRAPEEPGPPPPGSTTLWFDGGSRGNPGLSGAGAVIFDDTGKELYSGYKYLGERKTNNEAEYEGLLLGLRATFRLGAKRLVVKGDSMLVIQQMMGRWRVSAPKLVGLHRDASDLVLREKLECTWHHVRRNLNARADLLANIAMDSKGTVQVFDPTVPPDLEDESAPIPTTASPPSNSSCEARAVALSPAKSASRRRPSAPRSCPLLSSPGASAASAFAVGEREAAAIAAAKAAYEAVAADARAEIAGSVEILGGGLDAPRPPGDAVGSRAKGASTKESKCGSDGGAEEQDTRRFVIHVASWRKVADDFGGRNSEAASPVATAAAAILYEEGDGRKLKDLMCVSRCYKKPRALSPDDELAGAGGRPKDGDTARPAPPVDDTILGVLEEALGEVERLLLGGCGKVAVVTNDLALSALLSTPTNVAIGTPALTTKTGRGSGGATDDSSPVLLLMPPRPSTLERVLRLWRRLKGASVESPGGSELLSALTLARCCFCCFVDPPLQSPALLSFGTHDVVHGTAKPASPSPPLLPRGAGGGAATMTRHSGGGRGDGSMNFETSTELVSSGSKRSAPALLVDDTGVMKASQIRRLDAPRDEGWL